MAVDAVESLATFSVDKAILLSDLDLQQLASKRAAEARCRHLARPRPRAARRRSLVHAEIVHARDGQKRQVDGGGEAEDREDPEVLDAAVKSGGRLVPVSIRGRGQR